MMTKEIQKRNEKSQDLKVLRVNGNYFVESAEGMVLYKVCPNGEPDKYVLYESKETQTLRFKGGMECLI